MRTYLRDDYGIIKLQNCILNIAKYINDFCDKNNIDYCLMGGSALGAVRHEGFIPWDDDLDIFMRPNDYEKFRHLFNQEGDMENYYLQEWGAADGRVSLAKLRMNRTMLIEKDLEKWDIHQGVYIDIFILHTCPNKKLKRFYHYFWAKYLVIKGAANRNYKKSGIINILIKFCQLFPQRFALSYALKQIYKYRDEQSEYLCHFVGRAVLKNGLYKRKYFEIKKKLSFETIELNVPYQVENYLKDRWGDYMEIPSIESTLKYHHSWKWRDCESFAGFKQDGKYFDEKNLIA